MKTAFSCGVIADKIDGFNIQGGYVIAENEEESAKVRLSNAYKLGLIREHDPMIEKTELNPSVAYTPEELAMDSEALEIKKVISPPVEEKPKSKLDIMFTDMEREDIAKLFLDEDYMNLRLNAIDMLKFRAKPKEVPQEETKVPEKPKEEILDAKPQVETKNKKKNKLNKEK